jgi:Flp pilus assembly protein TadG
MSDARGSASLELVLVTPLVLLLLLFVVCAGRLAEARADVDRAARDAARAASIARDPLSAQDAGTSAASATLASGGISCRSLDVLVDVSWFAAGGTVATTVSCTVDLADLAELRVPGMRTLTATFVEPIDTFRSGS